MKTTTLTWVHPHRTEPDEECEVELTLDVEIEPADASVGILWDAVRVYPQTEQCRHCGRGLTDADLAALQERLERERADAEAAAADRYADYRYDEAREREEPWYD
jgi:NMD protein affecting ribosome stability and mRNA decay